MAQGLVKTITGKFYNNTYSKIEDKKYSHKKEQIETRYTRLDMGKKIEGKIEETETFWWCTAKTYHKGTGATAEVFEGRSKTTGQRVAVKVFTKSPANSDENKLRKKEFENLKLLRHRNIVQLLGIQKIIGTVKDVVIMEFCECSLLGHLRRPENLKGLYEKDFLTVLCDITKGMKYLRDCSYIHRDIKPGNVMRYIENNRNVVYKIADFGSARELKAGQTYESLYGTDEYLHPKIYQRAKIRKRGDFEFDESADLWSLGCTFYQVATGNVPFRPHGGRSNIFTMEDMHKKKTGRYFNISRCFQREIN